MKLIISTPNERAHSEPLSCAVWASQSEFYSVSDDQNVLKWTIPDNNVQDATASKLFTLPDKALPTCMKQQPTSGSGGRRGGGPDTLVIACGDGKVYSVSRSGRLEKAIEAHQGAVLTLRWVADGTAFATAGEDGQVKIWSRAGMYRNTLVQSGNPVYAIAWSPDGESIIYTDGTMLTVKPRHAGSKSTQWKAHDATILCVDWSPINNTIISGSEDRTIRLWDSFGRPVYSTKALFQQHPILEVAWSPDGAVFAAGSYDTIRLCNNAGWSEALEKPNSGGIYSIDWSRDSTGFVCGAGDGRVVCGKVTDKRYLWRHLEATVTAERSIVIHDTSNDVRETVELNANIARVSVGWNHLVVVTSTPNVVIYNSKNWNTPAMFELKDVAVSIIKQTERHFLLISGAGMQVYSYDGRVLATLRTQGVQCELLTEQTVSISCDTVALRDRKNEQAVFLFDALSGKPLMDGHPYKHPTEISDILLDQCGPAPTRNLAILDRNRDVYLLPVRPAQQALASAIKIASMVSQMMWDNKANILATIEDGAIWFNCNPAGAFIDQSLLSITKRLPNNEVARNSTIIAFSGNRATLRRTDGAIVLASIDPYPSYVHMYAQSGKWEDCQRLCRFVDRKHLWACLAAMSLQNRDVSTAIAAYAALSNASKVTYLEKIRSIPSIEGQNGELALLCHQQQQAEAIFLQAGLVYRAIDMRIRLCHWDQALDLATKHKTHVDTVVAHRQKHLQTFGRKETNKRFLQYGQGMEIDWEKINTKIAMELEKEEKRRQ
eukprot:scpid26601/ scgid17085/ Intraflagellar transport protein 80 homolog; WD repeat-containing protein 56